jgi:very-short-patch-repair endonuclease
MPSKIPKPLSPGEECFDLHCRAKMLKPEREYRFHPTRKWRFDYAFPAIKLAIEIEGLSRFTSRHTTFSGFREDCAKYNAATLLGWRILRYSTEMVMRGDAINEVVKYIEEV